MSADASAADSPYERARQCILRSPWWAGHQLATSYDGESSSIFMQGPVPKSTKCVDGASGSGTTGTTVHNQPNNFIGDGWPAAVLCDISQIDKETIF